jgi:hypothetical protein
MARLPYLDAFRLMRSYDRLFAISQATRQDTIRLAGVAPERIVCVYGDIDHRKRNLIENGGPAEAGAEVKGPEELGAVGRPGAEQARLGGGVVAIGAEELRPVGRRCTAATNTEKGKPTHQPASSAAKKHRGTP